MGEMTKEELKLSEEREKVIYWMLSIVFVLLIVAFFSSLPEFKSKADLEDNTVVSIIDGDTFEYYDQDTNSIMKVRLLCVDTPEKKEEGYEEAKTYLRSLILYKQVKMNSSIKDKDAYGRLLRYVYFNDWGEDVFVNQLILDTGKGKFLAVSNDPCAEMKIPINYSNFTRA